MNIILPPKKMLSKTSDVDYFHWNYQFPIKYVQLYRFRTMAKLLGSTTYNRLLEVGTGSGIFLPELARHCENLYAIDLHPYMDEICFLLNHYNVKNYEITSQSIEKTNYPDCFFDAIVAVSVLEFVDDLNVAISELKRILKDTGIFVTICPMNNKILDLIVSLYSKKTPKEEFGDSRKYVTSTLEENFKIEKKGFMMPLIGKYFPIYTHYKLRK